MKIYSRLSLVMLAACSGAGADDLFPTRIELPASAADVEDAATNPDRFTTGGLTPEAPEGALGGDVEPATNGDGKPPAPRDTAPGDLPPRDDEPPSIRATSPADGEAGVTAHTAIVLRFSESMDRATTLAALSSESVQIPTAQEWHDSDRELHLRPESPLAYADGDAETAPLTYVVDLSESSRDAAGNPLQARAFSFQTLRRVTQILLPMSDAELTGSWRGDGAAASEGCAAPIVCVGDDAFSEDPESTAQYRGFLSFDLEPLPDQQIEIVDARIHLTASTLLGDPFSELGELRLERAGFEALGAAAFEAAPQATFAAMTDPTLGATGEHILWALSADLESGGLHQYRLTFDRGSNRDGEPDVASFLPEEQRLEITYLIP